jgi:ParB family transcriptional regulator, chromosome partitioning protein
MLQSNNSIQEIPLDQIDDPAFAMRTEMDVDELQDLASSIKQLGLIEPIIVRAIGARYEVVAGHRRLKAAGIAGLTVISAIVNTASEEEQEVIKIHENFCRADVDLVDEAFFMAQAIQRLEMTPQAFAQMINRSVAYVNDRLMIPGFDDYLLEYLKNKRINFGVAKTLSLISDPVQRKFYVEEAVKNGITNAVASIWLRDAATSEHIFSSDQPISPELPLEAPTRTWTVECAICSNHVSVKEAKLAYAHSDCLQAIKQAN